MRERYGIDAPGVVRTLALVAAVLAVLSWPVFRAVRAWLGGPVAVAVTRSEERRVGKEGRGRGSRGQAEDGIRDLYVTGVQTCALPISAHLYSVKPAPLQCKDAGAVRDRRAWRRADVGAGGRGVGGAELAGVPGRAGVVGRAGRGGGDQIGRASCRERG